MRRLRHILLLLAVACSCGGPRPIGRADMEEIFYQMLIQDQQIRQDTKLKAMADTSQVYEGIFTSLGYTLTDYLNSLEYYLEEPLRMEKVMENVSARLQRELDMTIKEEELDSWREKLMGLYLMAPDTSLRPVPRPRAVDSLPIRFSGDSVYFANDTLFFLRDTL